MTRKLCSNWVEMLLKAPGLQTCIPDELRTEYYSIQEQKNNEFRVVF